MELWEQLLLGVLGLGIVFWFFPGIKATMEKSRNAEVKHWGTIALLAFAVIAFVIFLISTVQN
jgi:hypothetical protein